MNNPEVYARYWYPYNMPDMPDMPDNTFPQTKFRADFLGDTEECKRRVMRLRKDVDEKIPTKSSIFVGCAPLLRQAWRKSALKVSPKGRVVLSPGCHTVYHEEYC